MQRRDFLKGATIAAGAAGLAAASAFPTPAISQGMRELKLVTTWPKNFPGLGTGAQRFADAVTRVTGGKLTVKLFAAGELVPPFESFDAVSSGTADMYHAAEYYWQGKHKAFNFFTAVPYGFIAPEIDSWINWGGGQELWDELSAGFNLKSLPCGNTGVQMGGWFNKEIKSVEDLKGLKIRMPGLGGEVLRQLGAAAVTLPGGEITPALQSGAIDATEWVGPWNDLAFGFYKYTKYYYWPGFHEPGSTLAVGINKGVWDSFTTEEKAIVTACAHQENSLQYAEYNARNTTALQTLLDKHGVQLRQFDDSVMNAIGEVSGRVVADVATVDNLGERVYKSFIAFRQQAIAWNKIAEGGFTQARLLPFRYNY